MSMIHQRPIRIRTTHSRAPTPPLTEHTHTRAQLSIVRTQKYDMRQIHTTLGHKKAQYMRTHSHTPAESLARLDSDIMHKIKDVSQWNPCVNFLLLHPMYGQY